MVLKVPNHKCQITSKAFSNNFKINVYPLGICALDYDEKIAIYPNTTSGVFFINTENKPLGKLAIYNTLDKEIASEKMIVL